LTLHQSISRFRVASRELFNNYFRTPLGSSNDFQLEEAFAAVEQLLFEKLVLEPWTIPNVTNGYKFGPYPSIRVQVRMPKGATDEVQQFRSAPMKINRQIYSGYWDHPLNVVTNEATLLFICFFDFDQLSYRDNRYVRVMITEWKSHPAVVGKEALIESSLVEYVWHEA